MVENALIGTTQFDIFSLNPATCAENWRTREDYPPKHFAGQPRRRLSGWHAVSRHPGRAGAGLRLQDRERIWATTIADPKRGKLVPSAPIAFDGLVYVGNAGGDFKGGKGHMFALEAKTGKIVWEFFLVPREERATRPRTAGRDAARSIELEECARPSHQRWRNLDVLHARHENRAALRPRRQSSPRPVDRRARGRQFLYQLGRRARRQNWHTTKLISRL